MLTFLNIIIYSDNNNPDAMYSHMYKIHNQHYNNYKDDKDIKIDTYYIKLSEDIDSKYKLQDNVLYVKGKECWTPGILEKTLRAFEYFKTEQYDYIIRGNINTLIDIKLLAKELLDNPITFYGGGHKRQLAWLGGGITDDTWFGTEYIEGMSIIFSPDAIDFILSKEHLIRKDIIDDVAIGIFMREHVPDLKIQEFASRYTNVPAFVSNQNFNEEELVNYVRQNKFIFYRNKCCQYRFIDIIQMDVIHKLLKE